MRNYSTLICVTISFILFVNEVKSQIAVAGVNGAIYTDITPDTLLNPNPYPFGEEYYHIDINQDGTNDLELHAQSQISPGHTGQFIYVNSLDTAATSFSFWQTDSGYFGSTCNWWGYANILKPYNYGDTIENGNYVTSGYLAYVDHYTFCAPGLVCEEWIDSTDHYIGVKYTDTSGTSFGWIRVNVMYSYIGLIKDFSLWNSITGINELPAKNQLNIYPNPASNLIVVECGNNKPDEINIFNALSRKVICTKQNSIDIHFLDEGLYIIEVKTAKSFFRKLIIKR